VAKHLVLYDGVCGFCDRTIQFVLKRDKGGLFRFAPLQSDFAREAASRHGHDASKLDTLCLLLNEGGPDERMLVKGRAVVRILREIGGFWWIVSGIGALPTLLLDFGYDLVAGNRYRIFGRLEACRLPTPEQRDRFVGI
jgi:predicted DCC family thiol-disulfide oxidoreductase YuxK